MKSPCFPGETGLERNYLPQVDCLHLTSRFHLRSRAGISAPASPRSWRTQPFRRRGLKPFLTISKHADAPRAEGQRAGALIKHGMHLRRKEGEDPLGTLFYIHGMGESGRCFMNLAELVQELSKAVGDVVGRPG